VKKLSRTWFHSGDEQEGTLGKMYGHTCKTEGPGSLLDTEPLERWRLTLGSPGGKQQEIQPPVGMAGGGMRARWRREREGRKVTNGDGIAAVGNGTDIDQTQSMANGTTTAMTSRSRYEKSRRNTAAETMGKQSEKPKCEIAGMSAWESG
jgi:hypothetical protein